MNKKIVLTGFCAFLLCVQSITFADTEVNLNDSTSASGFTVKNASSDAILSARGDGKVGIGTTDFAHSSAKLEVNTGVNQNFVVRGPITLPSGVSLQAIQDDQVTDTNLEIYTGDSQNSQIQLRGNPITFYNNGERVRITSNGNVGIGTDNPADKLDVNGRIVSTNATNDNNRHLTFSGYSGNTWDLYGGHGGGGYFGIAENAGTPGFVVQATTGNVGIGTTNPGYKLDVSGGFFLSSSNGSNFWSERFDSEFDINGNSTKRLLSLHANSSGTQGKLLQVWGHNGANYILALDVSNTANVGIGADASSSYKLYVNGSAYSTGGWSGSDVRWKKEVMPLENSLSNVLELQGVSYLWKTDEYPHNGFTGDRQIGLIAQEVEKVIPELVHTDNEGYKSVSYEKLTAVLIEAVKEQQKQINALKNEKDEKIALLERKLLELTETIHTTMKLASVK